MRYVDWRSIVKGCVPETEGERILARRRSCPAHLTMRVGYDCVSPVDTKVAAVPADCSIGSLFSLLPMRTPFLPTS
jgi:hypothetical protein